MTAQNCFMVFFPAGECSKGEGGDGTGLDVLEPFVKWFKLCFSYCFRFVCEGFKQVCMEIWSPIISCFQKVQVADDEDVTE